MKLISSILAVATASHYRGGTYQIVPSSGKARIITSHTWRRNAGGYSPQCEQSDVTNQVSSGTVASAKCTLTTGSTCGSQSLKYTTTFVGDDYCYGDGVNEITMPSGPYSFGWNNCCWVPLTTDSGTGKSGGSMIQRFTVNDLSNTSPTFKLPPIWLIMAGCDGATIDLNPSDADGDKTKCRWGTSAEAGGAFNDGSWPSLKLDKDNCIITYTGSMDSTVTGVKAIGLMMEDFDNNGNVRSAVPVQFLAKVWTPNVKNRGVPWQIEGPAISVGDVSNNELQSGRRRRSVPSYCSSVPTFTGPTPSDTSVLKIQGSQISFELQATSQLGDISAISYQGPLGLTCSSVNSQGKVTCSWNLTPSQMAVKSHGFCFQAQDTIGMQTERRCISLEPAGSITNVHEMGQAVLDGSNNSFKYSDGKDYGCAGTGNFDYTSNIAGRQLDDADRAFYAWKKCMGCASVVTPVPAYDYDKDTDSCKNSSSQSRPICECDRELMAVLRTQPPTNANHNQATCVKGGNGNNVEKACCKVGFKYEYYSTQTHCCDQSSGVKEFGTC